MARLFRLFVSLSLLCWLAIRTDWPTVGEAFSRLRLELWLAALGLYLIAQVVSGWRWRLFSQALGFTRSVGQLTAYYFIGMFFNLFLPTSVGGDVIRALYLNAGERRRIAAFSSVLVDRISGLVVLLALACIAAATCPIRLPPWIHLSVWGAGLSALGGMVLLPWLGRHLGHIERIKRASECMHLLFAARALWARSMALSLVVQSANVILVWLVGMSLGASVPAGIYWVFVPMVTLLTLLPVSLNGMGIREAGTILFLAPFGVSEAMALSIALLWFLVFTAASLLGAVIYLCDNSSVRMEQGNDQSVGCDPDQGRARQSRAAA